MPDIYLPYNWGARSYQKQVWAHFAGSSEEGKRAACVWHRRAGKDLLGINLCALKSQERVGTYWHLLPTYKQGRNIVWNGSDRNGRRFLDYFPSQLIASSNTTEMRITFKNGSNYQVVGTDQIDSLVGTNPVGCVFSEYSLHDPRAWEYIRPILKENGGWALFIYTPRGKNHGYRLLSMAQKLIESGKRGSDKWFAQVLKAGSGPEATRREDGSPVISDDEIDQERREGMPEEMIQQEYYCNFEAPLVGAYYGNQMQRADEEHRITRVPHESNLPVDTYWDLGVGDATAIWFVQHAGIEHRVIDYYEASGEGLPHYIKELKNKTYVYGRHYAPHDIEVREFSSGKSRIETARTLGINFITVQKHLVEDGIDAVRSILNSCYFDSEKCERGIECLRGYRKERDEKRQTFKSEPVHDWTSHGADAFRMFAWSFKARKQHKPPTRAVDNFQYI